MRIGWAPLTASSCERHSDFDLCAVAGAAVEVECATQAFGPFAHTQQSKVAAQSGERFLLLEAATVVLHAQAQASRFELQPDADFSGGCVFQGVGHGLLR